MKIKFFTKHPDVKFFTKHPFEIKEGLDFNKKQKFLTVVAGVLGFLIFTPFTVLLASYVIRMIEINKLDDSSETVPLLAKKTEKAFRKVIDTEGWGSKFINREYWGGEIQDWKYRIDEIIGVLSTIDPESCPYKEIYATMFSNTDKLLIFGKQGGAEGFWRCALDRIEHLPPEEKKDILVLLIPYDSIISRWFDDASYISLLAKLEPEIRGITIKTLSIEDILQIQRQQELPTNLKNILITAENKNFDKEAP